MQLSYRVKRIIKRVIYGLKKWGFSEFHSFYFDTNRPLPNHGIDILRDIMPQIVALAREPGSVIRITDGTLLGLERDGFLIPHDNDLDFDVVGVDPSILYDFARAKNWTLGRSVAFKREIQQLAFFDEDEIIYDFIFWNKNGSFYVNYSERGYVRVQKGHFLENTSFRSYHGHDFLTPSDILSWLVMRYGSDWFVPAVSKGDWKEECGDLLSLDMLNRVNQP
jgi:hypothetical protein